MTLSTLSLIAAVVLPVLPGSWRALAGMVLGSVMLLGLGFYFCLEAQSHDPWNALGCLIILIAASIVALASSGFGAYRVAGQARGWRSVRFPQILLPALAFYLGAGGLFWLLVMALRY